MSGHEYNASAITISNPTGRVPRNQHGETLDRLRRMEVKITCIMEKLGVDTHAHKAKWIESDSLVDIPSLDIKLRDILAAVPKEISPKLSIGIMHKSVIMITFHVLA